MVNFSELIKVKNNLVQINSPKTINQLFYSICRIYVVYKMGSHPTDNSLFFVDYPSLHYYKAKKLIIIKIEIAIFGLILLINSQ